MSIAAKANKNIVNFLAYPHIIQCRAFSICLTKAHSQYLSKHFKVQSPFSSFSLVRYLQATQVS